MIVDPLASCHRAIPSFKTHFNKAPMAIAHSRMRPYLAPPTVEAMMSPAPMPDAATINPGPIILRTLFWSVSCCGAARLIEGCYSNGARALRGHRHVEEDDLATHAFP